MCESTQLIDYGSKKEVLFRGIDVKFVGEAQNDPGVIKKIISGSVPLVLITPENITSNSVFRNMLHSKTYREKLVTLVIDESHCIKSW